jgi:signal peptidase
VSARSVSAIWTAAAAWLLVVCSLVLWSLAPVVVGWRPSVIVTGSMLPLIKPGDVVVADPGARPRRGQIVLVADREAPTGRLAHRVVAINPDGTLITKGDANPTPDSVRHRVSDVVGVVRLVVPRAGRLALLRAHPDRGDLAWALMTGLAALAFVATHHSRPRTQGGSRGR